MSRKLLPLTVATLLLAITLESLGAPYRLVQGVCVLGVLVLALQIPDTVETLQALRDRDKCTGGPDES
jgi:hypothetical protein